MSNLEDLIGRLASLDCDDDELMQECPISPLSNIRLETRALLLHYASPEGYALNAERLATFFASLREPSPEERHILRRALLLCRGAALGEESVAVLRDELKIRAWGLLCPTCAVPAAPKWTRQDRPLGGRMQCTHTSSTRDQSVSHAAWSVLDARIQIVERPAPDFTHRHREHGKFAALEQR